MPDRWDFSFDTLKQKSSSALEASWVSPNSSSNALSLLGDRIRSVNPRDSLPHRAQSQLFVACASDWLL